MTMAKAVVTGVITRAPQERFTQNDVSVTSFTMNIGEREEMLLRVISRRKNLRDTVMSLGQNDKVLVEGRLQITTVPSDNGTERRIFEIDANAVEPLSALSGTAPASSSSGEEIVKFPKEEEFADELAGEDEIPF